jgi:CarD family transcriptional regulator
MNGNWNKRYRENMVRIKNGEIFEIGAIYKYLIIRDKEKGLSSGEKKMLISIRQILVSEIILAKCITKEEAEELLEVTALEAVTA